MRTQVGLAAVFVAALLAAPAGAAGRTDIQKVDLGRWPIVEIAVAAPSDAEDTFVVTEDGTPVEDLQIKSFTESGRSVDVVLVIDTSGSMEGEPIAAAREASRTFVRDVPENMRIGIVTFSDRPHVALRLTKNREAGLAILDRLVATGETALYDAVDIAATLFSGNAQRNIVLLSDGGDTASRKPVTAAISSTRRAKASVYSVGLTSGEADVPVLKRLAAAGRGRYSPADTADLSSLYRGLVTELENQYVVSYRSDQASGGEFTLEVDAAGATDSALISAPTVDVLSPRAPDVEAGEPLLEGRSGLIVVLSLSFIASLLIAHRLVSSSARRRRDAELSRLMAADSSRRSRSGDPESAVPGWIPGSLVEMADTVTKESGWAAKIDKKLDRAGLSLSPGEFLAVIFVSGLAGLFFVALFSGSVIMALLAGVVSSFVPQIAMSFRINRRFKKLEAQLPDILMIIATSLRAGHSFLQALDAVAAEIGDPGSHEFSRLVGEIRLGRSVTEAMNDLAERVGSDDFNWAILAVNIQREVGGNLAEVLDTVASTMRGRANVRRQVNVLAAEGRLSMYILGALPLLIASYLWMVNREYLSLLYTTGVGVAMLVLAAFLYVSGFAWMRKVVRIDV